MAAEDGQIFPCVPVETGGFAPLHHPRPAVQHGGRVSGLCQGEIDLIIENHLRGIGDTYFLAKEILSVRLAAFHLLLKQADVEGEGETVIRFHAHELAVGVGN
ncbi:MAG: hypothetical protein BWY79_00831 [Actinobacteria bacterium ADurb.Bin444]|nr:MAG: hypothetical protein BWY79_00831 [Actinobacteria bacterium ADurb.Bin444]